jgi:rare lipoprotein A
MVSFFIVTHRGKTVLKNESKNKRNSVMESKDSAPCRAHDGIPFLFKEGNMVDLKKQEESGITMFFCMVLALVLIVACSIGKPTTASWYGSKHQGRITASGQAFDQAALTAASWYYQIGSRVKVTNLKTNRSVEVLINDRGPAKRLVRQGRKIDLSSAAFARIADLKDGVVPVKIALVRN